MAQKMSEKCEFPVTKAFNVKRSNNDFGNFDLCFLEQDEDAPMAAPNPKKMKLITDGNKVEITWE